MNSLDRLLDRMTQPGVVLRIAVLSVCLLELTATVASLLGYRSDAFDGVVAAIYLRMGGSSNDRLLVLSCFFLVLLFAWAFWRLAVISSTEQAPRAALSRLILIDLLAICVTPGLPFLVTALAAVVLRARAAFLFALAQVAISLLLNVLLPLPEPVAANGPSNVPAWLDGLGLVMAMVALHGMAFGLGRMAAAEAEKRRWLQVMLAERLSAEQLQAEQLRYSERTLMARELHDVVGHHLTALNMQLQLGGALLQRHKTEGASQAVEKARECAAQLLADVRAAVSQQRSSQRIDLSAALHALAEGIALIRIELDIAPGARDLSPRVAHALLRCVQEAVTNSVRHAQASRVRITLSVDEMADIGAAMSPHIRVSIDDDGKGAPRLNPGNGLQGMAERMAELGGRMQVLRTHPGFKIELCCPRTV